MPRGNFFAVLEDSDVIAPGSDLPGWFENGFYSFDVKKLQVYSDENIRSIAEPFSAAPFPIAPLSCAGLRMVHMGFNEKGVPTYQVDKG